MGQTSGPMTHSRYGRSRRGHAGPGRARLRDGVPGARQRRDPRFDGRLCLGVTTTGIYCRPSCPARTPKPANVRFYAAPAAAVAAGFRACKRCRPDAAARAAGPGTTEATWSPGRCA